MIIDTSGWVGWGRCGAVIRFSVEHLWVLVGKCGESNGMKMRRGIGLDFRIPDYLSEREREREEEEERTEA